MNNTQNALLAIALSQSKILEISCLIEAKDSSDWKEKAVIRRPDGTFLKWEPTGTNPLKYVPGFPKSGEGVTRPLRKLLYLDTPTGTAKVSKEVGEASESKTAEEWSGEAIKEIEGLTEKLDGYQKIMKIAEDNPAQQRMRNSIKRDIDSILEEISKTSDFEKDMEGLTRSNKFNEYLGPVKNFVNRIQNSAKQGIKKGAEQAEGKAAEVINDEDKRNIALAATGSVALTLLAGVALKRGYAKALQKSIQKLSKSAGDKGLQPDQVADVAKQIGLSPNRLIEVLPEVQPSLSVVEKTIAGAENVQVVGKAIRRYRAGNVRRNVKRLDSLNKQAKKKAEEQLTKLSDQKFDEAWAELDSVFGSNWDKVQASKQLFRGADAPKVVAASRGSSMGTVLLLNAVASQDFKAFDDICAMLADFAGKLTEEDLSEADSLSADEKMKLQQEFIESMVDCN